MIQLIYMQQIEWLIEALFQIHKRGVQPAEVQDII
jgi:hypothetical protein